MKKVIEDRMVKTVHSGNPNMILQDALDLLKKFQIRHLPVAEDGKIVGVVSQKDLRVFAALQINQKIRIERIMDREMYLATKKTPLNEIIRTMQSKKVDYCIVVDDNNQILGIFTTSDAFDLLAEYLEKEKSPPQYLDDCYEPWNFTLA